MQFHSSDQAGILLNVYGEMKESLGRIEAKVDGQAEASEIRHKHLHKRIDVVEAKLESHRDITSRSSTNLYGTLGVIFKVLEVVYTNWPKIVWVLTAMAAVWGIKNPELLKLFSQTKP
jgi:hypothetical protein